MSTTIARVHVKMVFAGMSFNIGLIRTFTHQGGIYGGYGIFGKNGNSRKDFWRNLSEKQMVSSAICYTIPCIPSYSKISGMPQDYCEMNCSCYQ
jgi:hypothetical protein